MTAESLIEELQDPACYRPPPSAVRIIQTHLSVVCIAGERVYKLKKAVTLPFVDFAQLGARRKACRDEVRLNRRLCPDTYLGTAALRRVNGALRFADLGDDDGDDLDVAVVMRRLPQERMLDELVRDHEVGEAQIDRLAELIARFHEDAERGPEVTAHGDPHKLATFAAANFAELRDVRGHGLSPALLDRLAAASAAGFARLLPRLEQRAVEGRVVDGHGDLHARNVCMTDPPTVYDCIEFEPAFRCGDVATEVAFLTMDLRFRGAPELARRFVGSYVRASGDAELPALLPTLSGYRAMVRAKVDAIAASEAELPAADRDAARRAAHRHVQLAAAYAIEDRGPLWLVVCGPPASGKSRLAEALASAVRWPWLATDVVRKQLAGIAPTAAAAAGHYTAEFSRRTYDELLRRARQLTEAGERVVLLDGNFPTAGHRAAARAAAAAVGAALAIVFVDVDVATAERRAAARRGDAHNVSDADPKVTRRLHERFAAPTPAEGAMVVRLDGTTATDRLADELLAALLA